jgi:hypothetical protein
LQFGQPLSANIEVFNGSQILVQETPVAVAGSISGLINSPLQFRGMAVDFDCADLPNQSVTVTISGRVSGNIYFTETLQNNGNGNRIFTNFDVLPEAEIDAAGDAGQFAWSINFDPGAPTQNVDFTLVAIGSVYRPFNKPYFSATQNYSKTVQMDASGAASITITPDASVRILQIGWFQTLFTTTIRGVIVQGQTSGHVYYSRTYPGVIGASGDNGLNDYVYINPDLDGTYTVTFTAFGANNTVRFVATAVSSAPVANLYPTGPLNPDLYQVQPKSLPFPDTIVPATTCGAGGNITLIAPQSQPFKLSKVFFSNTGTATYILGNLVVGPTIGTGTNIQVYACPAGFYHDMQLELIVPANSGVFVTNSAAVGVFVGAIWGFSH